MKGFRVQTAELGLYYLITDIISMLKGTSPPSPPSHTATYLSIGQISHPGSVGQLQGSLVISLS